MSKLRSEIIESMISHAQGHIDKHKMNVEVYLTTPAGIGDHPDVMEAMDCLLYTSPSPRDVEESRMPSSA